VFVVQPVFVPLDRFFVRLDKSVYGFLPFKICKISIVEIKNRIILAFFILMFIELGRTGVKPGLAMTQMKFC